MSDRCVRIRPLAALTLVVLSLAAACNRPSTAPETPPRPPRIAFRQNALTFGVVDQGMRVRQVFPLRNDGSLDLTIDNLRASCGCTASLLSAPGAGRVITGGGEAAIEVICDTATDVGRKPRTITVYSNDPAQPVTNLTLRGEVRADVAADPPRLYVGHLARGQVAPYDVRLVASDPAVSIGAVEDHGRVIAAVLRDPVPGSAERRVRIAIKPDAPFGRFTESVKIHTSSTRRPVLTVPVTGVVDDVPALGGASEKKS
jgi:hypothetical protein